MTEPHYDDSDRASAWDIVQRAIDAANDKIVEWQARFASVGPVIGDPPDVPDTRAHRNAQDKRQRHADAVAEGRMTYADIAVERQQEFAMRFAGLPDTDRALLNDWAARQEAKTRSPYGVVYHHALPWPQVFLVARFGEEVEHWPLTLSEEDRSRVSGLDRGGKALKFVESLDSAASDHLHGRRTHLFIQRGQEHHLAAALTRVAPRPATTGE